MKGIITAPFCDQYDCFGYQEGRCAVLNNNDFGEKECPFFKTNDQVAELKCYCEKRLNNYRKRKVD